MPSDERLDMAGEDTTAGTGTQDTTRNSEDTTSGSQTETASDPDTGHGQSHSTDTREYDPEHVSLPSRAPPLRSTAPQSFFTTGQVAIGAVVLAIGLAVVFGVPLALI